VRSAGSAAALFTYRTAALPSVACRRTVRVGFLGAFPVTWTWDAPSATWKRSIFGSPERVASGTQLAPKNVVVMFVRYEGGDPNHFNIGAEAVLTGTGKALVYTGARRSPARGHGRTRAGRRNS